MIGKGNSRDGSKLDERRTRQDWQRRRIGDSEREDSDGVVRSDVGSPASTRLRISFITNAPDALSGRIALHSYCYFDCFRRPDASQYPPAQSKAEEDAFV
jgi:hypothetical protein